MPVLEDVLENPEARKASLGEMKRCRRARHGVALNEGFKSIDEVETHLARDPYDYKNLGALCQKAKDILK